LDASYRLGNSIVLGVLLVSLGVCLAGVSRIPEPARAGQDLGDHGFPLGAFALVERSGRRVTDADFGDGPWVASFIFTRCPLSCPRISSVMKGLQGKLVGSGVRLVSISVDPGHDTPELLADYARRFGADPERWWFLTGPEAAVHELVKGRFKLGLEATSSGDQQTGAEAFVHSDRLALVNRGKVVGFFDSTDPKAIDTLTVFARRLDAVDWVRKLPALNATLNGTCALLLTLGWILIRTGNFRGHAACMLAAVGVSTVFLASYLVYHFQVGSVPFRGVGLVRVAYFAILLSHTLLATLGVVPLVVLTLIRAVRREFHRHSRIAKVTFPIWMYVSITGVIIYLMLYHMPVADSSFAVAATSPM
jgi:protein SCO1/2/putative membrane protein